MIESFDDKMVRMRDSITTRQDLSDYLQFLADGFRDGEFEKQSVADYLDGASMLLDEGTYEGWHKNAGWKLQDQPDWRVIGRLLTTAFVYD